uniref:MULE domain-containing protein n=1 Tax=Steinernema glaseri TaxID=37863 RepID=A0A1I7YTF4_9BILA
MRSNKTGKPARVDKGKKRVNWTQPEVKSIVDRVRLRQMSLRQAAPLLEAVVGREVNYVTIMRHANQSPPSSSSPPSLPPSSAPPLPSSPPPSSCAPPSSFISGATARSAQQPLRPTIASRDSLPPPPAVLPPSLSLPHVGLFKSDLPYAFLRSKYGGEILCISGPEGCRTFCKVGATSKSGVRYYQCLSCRKSTLPVPGSIRVINGQPETLSVSHNAECEAQNAEQLVCTELDRNLRQLVRFSGIPSSLAYSMAHVVLKVSGGDELAAKFAPYHVYRRRLDSTKRDVLPSMTDAFAIPEELTKTVDKPGLEKPFLLSSSRELKIYIFATEDDLKLAAHSDIVIGDSTFDVAPQGWQLLTLHMRYLSPKHKDYEWTTFLHAVMRNRTEESYTYVFEKVAEVWNRAGLLEKKRFFRFDFERAQLKAAETVFGRGNVGGCLFHYTQALIRNLKSHGLFLLYKSDKAFHNFVRNLCTLPLLPPQFVHHTWKVLFYEAPRIEDKALNKQIAKFLTYFTQQWINDVPLRFWNFWLCDVRTTNVAEGYHSRLQQHPLAKKHPNIIGLVSFLRLWHSEQATRKRQLCDGAKPKPRNLQYDLLNERLKKVFERLQSPDIAVSDIFSYLRACRLAIAEFSAPGVTTKMTKKRKVEVAAPVNVDVSVTTVLGSGTPSDDNSLSCEVIGGHRSVVTYYFCPPSENEIDRISKALCVKTPDNASVNPSSNSFTSSSPPKWTGKSEGDGCCGFRSIIQCIFGPETDENIHLSLRRAICCYIEKEMSVRPMPYWIIAHSPDNETLLDHVEKMKKPETKFASYDGAHKEMATVLSLYRKAISFVPSRLVSTDSPRRPFLASSQSQNHESNHSESRASIESGVTNQTKKCYKSEYGNYCCKYGPDTKTLLLQIGVANRLN